jgi:rhodanese-related sulfurtransferase/polyisoprenoid-binding protein YceI
MEKSTVFRKILPEKVHEKLTNAEELVLIDTLTEDHFNKVHIAGAVNACVFEVLFIENVKKILSDKNKEIIVYGSSNKSMDAMTAAEKLTREGYRNVSTMEGGLKQWVAMGLELAGEDPTLSESTKQPPKWIDYDYAVDVDKSIIEWIGRNPNTRHYGTIGLSKGEITVRNSQIGGSFEIDMKSIKNINLESDPLQPLLINHLMSDDFFFVKMFPVATFTITSAKPIKDATSSEPNFEVQGLLELRGMKKDIHFLANASGEQCGEVKIEAHFDLDRTRWGVIYGSTRFFEHLGMHLVFDSISIQIRLITK